MECGKKFINWKWLIICIISLIFFNFNIIQIKAATLGISPSVIDAGNVLNNANLEKTINISTPSVAEEDLKYKVVFHGYYAHYLQGPEEVVILAGKNSADYTFDISPANAANGSYEAYIDFLTMPSDIAEQGKAMVAITTGVTATIKMAVSDQLLLEYDVFDLQISDSEIGQPLYIEYVVNNTGNTEWKPDKIELIINDVADSTNIGNLSITKDIPITNPGSQKKYKISIDHQLIQGEYTAQGLFYYQNEKVAELVSQKFQINAAGTLQQKGEFISFVTNKKEYLLGEKIKVEADFRNAGDIALKGILVTELFSADNSLIDLRRSLETEIMRAEEKAFTEYYQLDKIGVYSISGYIEYGNKKSETKTVPIKVAKPKGFIDSNIIAYSLLIIVTIIIFLFVFLFRRRKNKNNKIKK